MFSGLQTGFPLKETPRFFTKSCLCIWGRAIRERFPSESAPATLVGRALRAPRHVMKGNDTMKLTKEQVMEKRDELCKVLIVINHEKEKADNIKKDLADDFDKNEKAYRKGIVTSVGVLYRKPRFDLSAKEKLNIGD